MGAAALGLGWAALAPLLSEGCGDISGVGLLGWELGRVFALLRSGAWRVQPRPGLMSGVISCLLVFDGAGGSLACGLVLLASGQWCLRYLLVALVRLGVYINNCAFVHNIWIFNYTSECLVSYLAVAAGSNSHFLIHVLHSNLANSMFGAILVSARACTPQSHLTALVDSPPSLGSLAQSPHQMGCPQNNTVLSLF